MKRHLIFCIKLLVTLVPAYFAYTNIVSNPEFDSSDFANLIANMKAWPLAVAVLCLFASNFTGCLQWKSLLQKQGVDMNYWHLFKLYFIGLFFNNFMPGNVGGDVKKVYDIRVQGGQDTVGAGLTATFFDRFFGLFFMTLLALGVGFMFFVRDPSQRMFVLPSLWCFLGFCVLFAALFSKRIGRVLASIAKKIFPEGIFNRIVRMQDRFQYFRIWSLWGEITVLSAVTQILRILVHYFCGLALGLDIAVSWYFFYIPLVAIISALPISIGGFGPRELLAQSLFARVGVPHLESVVVQLLAYLAGLVVSLLGAFFFLTDGGKKQVK